MQLFSCCVWTGGFESFDFVYNFEEIGKRGLGGIKVWEGGLPVFLHGRIHCACNTVQIANYFKPISTFPSGELFI